MYVLVIERKSGEKRESRWIGERERERERERQIERPKDD